MAQSPIPPSAIRIDVNLVQVDAVVTDSQGRHVPNLEAGDFELFQDGKKQAITNFAYVAGPAAPAREHKAAQVKSAKGEPPPPPQVLQPSEVRRALALVVDDLGLSGESIPKVRSAIKQFLDEQMRSGDLVAIVRTGAGMGALQQFTTDKQLLYAALDRVKYSESRVGVSTFEPLGQLGGGRGGRAAANLNHFREEDFTAGSLGAVAFVVNAMADLPGRKSVVLFTENIRLIFRNAPDAMVAQAVEKLTDAADRAAVVIHAIDPRGIPNVELTAADNTSRTSSRRVSRVPQQRQEEVFQTEQGMFVLAEETGGLFLHDTDDLAGALRKAAQDSDGYYLLGYHPESGTFETGTGRPKFHRLEVRVHKQGLHVRSRPGFFGQPGDGNLTPGQTRDAQIDHALMSPYSGAMHPRVTAIFSNQKQTGSVLTAFIYFRPEELKWATDAEGNHQASLDLATATFDENGAALGAVDTTFALHLTAQQFKEASQKGLVCGRVIAIPKPGPYLLRAALRDPATEKTGSAEQFVEVPDLNNGHLALSGMVMQDGAMRLEAAVPASPTIAEDFTGGAARRTFRQGTAVDYYYEILNAELGAGQTPQLEVYTRLFHDGAPVISDRSAPRTEPGAADPGRLRGSGRLTLGANLAPGDYVLQVVVTDKLTKSRFNTAAQSVDFEIVR